MVSTMSRARKLVVFSDGTGNSAAKLNKTNVWRTYQALDLSSDKSQLAFYDDGVGNSSFRPLALAGGVLGIGLARNVKEIYSFLCRNYRPDDEIYAFGFSRGAFTVRILVALIESQGLILDSRDDVELARRVATAYRRYRANYHTIHGFETVLRWLRDSILTLRDLAFHHGLPPLPDRSRINSINIHFLGLWDTVDAYGLPIEEMTSAWDNFIWPLSMRDRNLWPNVQKACHALALDDERQVFQPLLWNEEHEKQDAAHTNRERVSQVWFAGAHANVGGGYANDALAMVPLLWMIGEAKKAGLAFVPQVIAGYRALADATGPIYDPRSGSGLLYRYNPRLVSRLCNDRITVASVPDAVKYSQRKMEAPRASTGLQNKGVLVTRPKLHHSVLDRLLEGVDRYAPIVLPFNYAVVGESGKITPSFVETHEQMNSRKIQQQHVWNYIWLRRVVYYATITIFLALLILPLIAEKQKILQANPLAALISVLQAFLPSFTSTWTEYLLARPGAATKVLIVFAVLVLSSMVLKKTIASRMYVKWQQLLAGNGQALPMPGEFSHFVTALRTHWLYQWFFYTFLKKYCAPFAALCVFAFLATAVLSRAWYVWQDARGAYCSDAILRKPVPPKQDQSIAANRVFEASNPCFQTGIFLRKEFRYQVELTMQKGSVLYDEMFPASLDRGLARSSDLPFVKQRGMFSPDLLVGAPSYSFALSSPFKRVPGERYMKPVARIGTARGEEHVLEPVVISWSPLRIVAEFTAGQSGELFLYLNDAVLFSPNNRFYANNRGKIIVRVRAVTMTDFPSEVRTAY